VLCVVTSLVGSISGHIRRRLLLRQAAEETFALISLGNRDELLEVLRKGI